MIRMIAAATIFSTAALAVSATAQAEDFPAAPMNPGPMRMTGMGPVGDAMNLGMMPMNMMAQPAGGAGPAAESPAAPMAKKHHHMKHMMKKDAM